MVQKPHAPPPPGRVFKRDTPCVDPTPLAVHHNKAASAFQREK